MSPPPDASEEGPRPTELECVVLGIVWKFGPCTPHAVRTHFVGSKSSRFSGSAGAIYPLVERLQQRGSLLSREDHRERRRRRMLSLTKQGLAELRGWFDDPRGQEVLGLVHDPVRVRLYFLEALPPRRRRAFVDESIEGLRATLASVRAEREALDVTENRSSDWALQGAEAIARAQIRWLKTIRDELDGA